MKIKDPFSYSARWDSVGLGCSSCMHFNAPKEWPDKSKVISCKVHNISLRIELNDAGYMEGEWSCKDFSDNGKFHENALEEFKTTQGNLKPEILYSCYNKDGFLRETSLGEFKNL